MSGPTANFSTHRRYVAIDGLRFIAAVGVVAHHYAGLAGFPLATTLFAKNYLFVDFFFAISGFVIFHNYRNGFADIAAYMDFLRNRLARIYPLHLLTFLVFALLAFTLWRDKTDRAFVDPSAILPNLLLAHAWGVTHSTAFNYPSWSISAEWLAYLSFPAVVWLIRRGGAGLALGVAGLIVVGLELAGYLGLIEPWTTLTYHFGALRALPTFLFGAALAHGVDRIRPTLSSFAPAWLMFGASVAAMLAGADDRIILVLLMASVAATVIAERDGATGILTRPAMARLGDLSYAIYMIHPLMGIGVINLLGVRVLHLGGWPLAVWCVVCAVAINPLAAMLVHDFVESPSRRWLRHARLPRLSPRRPMATSIVARGGGVR